MLGLGHKNKEIVNYGNWMTGISRNLQKWDHWLSSFLSWGHGFWKSGNVTDIFKVENETSDLARQNKRSVRKAAYFYRILKKLSNMKKKQSWTWTDRWKENIWFRKGKVKNYLIFFISFITNLWSSTIHYMICMLCKTLSVRYRWTDGKWTIN